MPKARFGDLLQYLRRMYPADDAGDRTDGELLNRFVTEREEDAFTVLVQRHARMVLGVCQRLLGDQHLAEDSFQATFIILARRASSIGWHRSVGTWLYAVAQRVAMKAKAKASALRKRETESGKMPRAERLDEQTWLELRSVIDEEIGSLPEKYQAPLVLCHLEGKSHDRAAKELGCAKTTLERRLSRGRELLRQQLIRRGVTLSAAVLATALGEKVMGAPVAALLTVKTAQAAVHVLAGKAAGACLTARALALAEEAMVGMVSVKGNLVLMVLALGLAVGGAGWAGYGGLGEKAQPDAVAQAQPPAANDQVAGPAKKDPLVRTDQYGDPLPEGAVARLGAARFRHEGIAEDLAYTPDGKILLGHTNSGLILWDAATGRELRRLPVPRPRGLLSFATATNNGMAVSPDGQTLAIAEGSAVGGPAPMFFDSQISFWDLATGKKTRTFVLPKVAQGSGATRIHPNRLFFSSDGKRLISLASMRAEDRKAIVLDLESGQVRMSLGSGDPHGFYDGAISPDGKTLAAVTFPTSGVQLWDVVTGKLIRTIVELPQNSLVNAIAFSPDGKALAFATPGHLYLVDLATGKEAKLEAPRASIIMGLAFTGDGKKLVWLASGAAAMYVRVNNVDSGKILHNWEYGRHSATMVRREPMAVSPDGKTVALAGIGNTVQVRDVATGKEQFPENYGHEAQISSLVFSPDGKAVASADDGNRINGNPALATEGGHQILLWDTVGKLQFPRVQGRARALSFSPDGKQLAIIAISQDESASRVRIWDVAGGMQTMAITVPGTQIVRSADFSPDGRKLFTLDWNKNRQNQYSVRHWDLTTGQQDQEWAMPYHDEDKRKFFLQQAPPRTISQPTLPLALAPDGRTVFAAQENKAVGVYDVDSGRQRSLPGHENKTGWDLSFSVSPDARILASWIKKPIFPGILVGSPPPQKNEPSSTIQLGEVVTGKEIILLEGHQGAVVNVAWSRDGRLLASGERRGDPEELSDSQTVRLWDAATGKELARFGGFKTDVTALNFAPDGKSLGAGLRDGSILLWDVSKIDPKRVPAPNLGKSELEASWTELASANAAQAHQAIGTLVGAPKDAMPFLRGRLQPAPVMDAGKIRQWILDQDSTTFAVRQTSAKELEKAGAQAQAPIQKAIKEHASLEGRLRLEQILKSLDVARPETVRTVRAITALERIGSLEAQGVLDKLAHGAPGSRETEEAMASLQRLDPRGRGRIFAREQTQSVTQPEKPVLVPAKPDGVGQVKNLPLDNGPAAEALRAASSVLEKATGDLMTRCRLWCAVAELRWKLGDKTGAASALLEAKKIGETRRTIPNAYTRIGQSYGRFGDTKAVLDLAAATVPPFEGKMVLSESARAAELAGNFRQAEEIVDAMIDPQTKKNFRANAGRAALVQRAKAGDFAGALEAAGALPTPEEKVFALVGPCPVSIAYDDDREYRGSQIATGGVASVLFAAGKKAEARKASLQALALVPEMEEMRRVFGLLGVVRILVRMDDLPTARKASAQIAPDAKEANPLSNVRAMLKAKGYIAAAEARAGRDDAALALAQDFKEPSQQAYILQEVALAQARVGRKDVAKANLHRAFEMVTRFPKNSGTTLHNIASAQALVGDFAGASKTMEEMDPKARTWKNVVQAQLEAGDFVGARVAAEAHQKDPETCMTIAFFQAKAGQFEAVRAWVAMENYQLLKAHLLVGLAEGLYRDGAKIKGR